MIIVDGNGCGKSTLFYHKIEQCKKKAADDVMIIFDNKRNFFSKFYDKKDCVIVNFPQHI